MTDPGSVLNALHSSFTDAISVRSVPFGLAINSPFYDESGDSVAFYARESEEGLTLEDDGSFIPSLIASGIDVESGQRRFILDQLLKDGGAYLDPDTFEIKTPAFPSSSLGPASVRFLATLLRVKTLETMTREVVRSTFKEDAVSAIEKFLSDEFRIEEKTILTDDLSDFPADVVLRPRDPRKKALGLFLVNNSTQLLEADLLRHEIDNQHMSNVVKSVALIEDTKKIPLIGDKRYQRAVNRGLPTLFFRGDEKAAMAGLSRIAA
ncbi:DUF1828 domain-containing protein [Agrobacterium tumefaciens]|uniref:DUF1828 domain-containing protein n=1 Tax=Agrobacterium tumefaciens complex TaxID=1183400 RepID=UPI001659090D|nr:DUF1828 domain-containing protein [Agrobacterium tumefaciens]QNP81835.1 DUF1828 domain-containing protein [Agrobacterium tumefaciens]